MGAILTKIEKPPNAGIRGQTLLPDPREAKVLRAARRNDCNHHRPQSSQGYRAPAALAAFPGSSVPNHAASNPLRKAPGNEVRGVVHMSRTLTTAGK